MDISKLLNPVSISGPILDTKGSGSRQLDLPLCIAKPRKHSRVFLLDEHGFIRLTPPRRTIAIEKQEFVSPQADLLFEDRAPISRRLTVRYNQHGHIRVLCNAKWTLRLRKDYGPSHLKHQQLRHNLQAYQLHHKAPLLPPNHDNVDRIGPGPEEYADMWVDLRTVRSEEEERRVQEYHATMAMRAFMYPLPTRITSVPILHENIDEENELIPMISGMGISNNVGASRAILRPADWSAVSPTKEQG